MRSLDRRACSRQPRKISHRSPRLLSRRAAEILLERRALRGRGRRHARGTATLSSRMARGWRPAPPCPCHAVLPSSGASAPRSGCPSSARSCRARVEGSMNLINILFIENSVGLAGSTMSLCSLLDYLDADLFEAHIALSRNEQEGYLLGHLRRPAHMTVIAPGASLRQASWAQRLLNSTQRRVPWLRGSVARAIAALEVFVVTIPYALRLRRWIKDRNIALIHHNNGFDVGPSSCRTCSAYRSSPTSGETNGTRRWSAGWPPG